MVTADMKTRRRDVTTTRSDFTVYSGYHLHDDKQESERIVTYFNNRYSSYKSNSPESPIRQYFWGENYLTHEGLVQRAASTANIETNVCLIIKFLIFLFVSVYYNTGEFNNPLMHCCRRIDTIHLVDVNKYEQPRVKKKYDTFLAYTC